MSPCADHGVPQCNSVAEYLHSLMYEAKMYAASQDTPLDLSKSGAKRQESDTLYTKKEHEVKEETEYDDVVVLDYKLGSSSKRHHTGSPSKAHDMASSYVGAKHSNLPMTLTDRSNDRQAVAKKFSCRETSNSHTRTNTSAHDLGVGRFYQPISGSRSSYHGNQMSAINKNNGQYVSPGLSGGTCKVVSNDKSLHRSSTIHHWNYGGIQTSSECAPSTCSPIPTVVRDLDGADRRSVIVSRPSRTQTGATSRRSPYYRTSSPVGPATSAAIDPSYSKQPLKVVNDLVKRRNALMSEARKYFHSPCSSKSDLRQKCEEDGSLFCRSPKNGGRNLLSPYWSRSLGDGYGIQDGERINVVSPDSALTVQSKGLCGGTMVSCEPSPQSLIASMNTRSSVFIPQSLDYLRNFSAKEDSLSSYSTTSTFASRFPQMSIDDFLNPTPWQTSVSGFCMKESQTMTPTKHEFDMVKVKKEPEDYDSSLPEIKSEKDNSVETSDNTINAHSSISNNLALLSNVCSLISTSGDQVATKDKEITKDSEKNVTRKTNTPESGLPLKKRKLSQADSDENSEPQPLSNKEDKKEKVSENIHNKKPEIDNTDTSTTHQPKDDEACSDKNNKCTLQGNSNNKKCFKSKKKTWKMRVEIRKMANMQKVKHRSQVKKLNHKEVKTPKILSKYQKLKKRAL